MKKVIFGVAIAAAALFIVLTGGLKADKNFEDAAASGFSPEISWLAAACTTIIRIM